MIEILTTGIVYKNPKPHVRSVHAYFPSVAVMDNGEMLATFALGEAFEAANCRLNVARSKDMGETWALEGPVYPGTKRRLTSDYGRVTAVAGGAAVILMMRHDRAGHSDEGLGNPETIGTVPTECLLVRSKDYGRTWSKPAAMKHSLPQTPYEICCPITPLKDGRWIVPSSTWPTWEGACPNGLKLIAFVSRNRGRTWPEHWDVMKDPKQEIFYWESKIVELQDGRLLAVAWAYNRATAKDLPNQYALSSDGGATWSQPMSMGLHGQTLAPFILDDGRVLCVYRRMDQPGLWAVMSRLDGDRWVNEEHTPLWGAQAQSLTSTSTNMIKNFNVLRFGAPCIAKLPDGTIFAAFWCYEDCISVIRWYKLKA